MGLFKRIGRLFGAKGDPQAIDTSEKLAQALGAGYDTHAGQRVTTSSALQQLVVFNCIRVLSESIGMLPCRLLKQTGKVRLPATSHRLYPLLTMAPNSFMTSQEFWEMLVACLCLRGNFFAYKVMALGNVVELLPLNPDIVTPKLKDDWTVEYTVNFKTGQRVLTQDEIWHVRLFTLDGLNGLNPIAYARQALGLGQAMDNAYGEQLAAKEVAHQTERTHLANANAAQILAEQGKRLALEQWLAASDQFHYRALTDEKTKQVRLRDRLATADLRLSVQLDAASTGCDGVQAITGTGTGSVVHGPRRAQLDPAHAQRIIGITGDGDQGLIALQACQAYAKEVSDAK